MKKVLLSLVMALLAVSVNAQAIYGYGSSIQQGSYTALTDATVIALGTDDALKTNFDDPDDPINNFNQKLILPSGVFEEETTGAGYPIGFEFKFNDKTFTSFGIATNGGIYLGNEEVTLPAAQKWIFTRDNTNNVIGFVPNRGTACNEETVISYKLEGTAPERTLVIEFKEFGALQGFWGVDAYFFDFQVRLHEGTNAIDIVVNGMADALSYVDEESGTTETNTILATIGIKGEGGEATAVFTGTMAEWARKNGSSDTFEFDNTVVDGTTFAISYPTDVVTPTVQPTDLVINQFSTSLTGSFTPAEGVDQYLLVYQEGKEITTLPTDKTTYAEGDKLGEATVLRYYDDFKFEVEDLTVATDYTFAVFAVNAFGLNGPAYNTVNPLTVVTYTRPAAPATFEFAEIGETTAKINLTANEAGNKIIVVYNSELVRSNYGDYPLIGELAGEYTSGQEIEGGGKVAYFGEAGEDIEITALEHSKGYFFEAYSYDPTYGYSTDKLESAQATVAHLPYALDMSVAKTYDVPAGWVKNEGSTFEVPRSVSGFTSEEIPYLLWCKVTKGNATNGVLNQITSNPIIIDQEDAVVRFNFTIFHQPSRFLTEAYNVWNENDVFAVQVSTDGETFTDLVSYNSTNNPQFVYTSEEKTLVPFEADMSQYEGQKVWIRINWHLYNNTFSPGTLVLDNFKVEKFVVPAIPAVKMEDVAHISAKVTWRGEQENYEVAYAKTVVAEEGETREEGEGAEELEFVTIKVEGASEYVLTELEAETEYQVKVRGIIDNYTYSEWSEIVTFTTTAWPECDAPTNLAADMTAFVSDGIVTLTWEGTEDHLTWDVRYRDANSTTWITIEGLEEPTTVLEGLEEGVTYLWNVRAYCTAERVTAWSAQATFKAGPTVPAAPVVTGSFEGDIIILEWEAVPGALTYKLYYGGKALTEPFEETIAEIQVPSVGTYCFTVTALNEVGESAHSDEVCVTVTVPEGMTVPETPELVATLDNNFVVLTWEAVEGATYYDVYVDVENGQDQYLGTATMEDLPIRMQLPEYGIYCFYIVAANLAGESEPSNTACVNYGNVGVEENEFTFNIYPNPVNDKLVIETEANIEEICIYDAFGRLMTTINGQATTVDVSEYNAGVYIMKLRTDNGEIVKRFVKK